MIIRILDVRLLAPKVVNVPLLTMVTSPLAITPKVAGNFIKAPAPLVMLTLPVTFVTPKVPTGVTPNVVSIVPLLFKALVFMTIEGERTVPPAETFMADVLGVEKLAAVTARAIPEISMAVPEPLTVTFRSVVVDVTWPPL